MIFSSQLSGVLQVAGDVAVAEVFTVAEVLEAIF